MPDTGWVLVGSGANATAPGGMVSWSNAGNITVDSSSIASATGKDWPSHYLRGTNAPLDALLPANVDILGVEVRIRRLSGLSARPVRDNAIQLVVGGVEAGDNNAVIGVNWPISAGTVDYGGPTDLWGLALTRSQVAASDFGVSIQAGAGGGGSGSRPAEVEAVWLRIHYEESAEVYEEEIDVDLQLNLEQAATKITAGAVALGLELAMQGVVANSIQVQHTLALTLGMSAVRMYTAEVPVTFGAQFIEEVSSLALFEPAVSFGLSKAMSAARTLHVEFSADWSISLEEELVGGILYGAAVDFSFALNAFFVPGMSYEDSLTWSVELLLEQANNLGAIELTADLEFLLDLSVERGREWLVTALFQVDAGAALLGENRIEQELEWDLGIGVSFIGDRGILVNEISLGLRMETFAVPVKFAAGTAEFSVGLDATMASLALLQPSIVFGLAGGFLATPANVLNLSFLQGLQVNAGLTGGFILERSISAELNLRMSPEIVDYDLLLEVYDTLELEFSYSFEAWLSKKLSPGTTFTPGSAGSTAYTSVQGPPQTTYTKKDNFEDPDFQAGNESEG